MGQRIRVVSDNSYSVSDIQNYFAYIIKNHETLTDNPPIWIYINRIDNRIAFKIKTGYYVELSALETMKLPGSNEKRVKLKLSHVNVRFNDENSVS